MMYKPILLLLISIVLVACDKEIEYDLVIKNATVLDVETGTILRDKSIVIHNGKIENITDDSKSYKAIRTINANKKLITPGFIDTHIHPTDVFGDREKAPKSLDINARKKLSDAYLPYGTTTTLMLGQPESWLTTILNWQNNPASEFTDHYTSGGAMISKEDRAPYIAHCVLEDTIQAKEKVIEYHKLGIRHIKLYYRLNEPEFKVAFKTADSLGMSIYGHIGGFGLEHLKINETLKLGLDKYEHLGIIPNSVLTDQSDWDKLNKQFVEHFGGFDSESRVLEYLLEQYRFLHENKSDDLEKFIDVLAKNKVSVSTTIQILYQQFAPTYFTKPSDIALTDAQTKRCVENFEIFIKYVKKMHDKGIEIRLGSDMPNGGKVNISELMLLCNYGFSVEDVFKIASLNGAKAIGIENEVGSLKKNRKANLIIWEHSPFDAIQNFTADKTILKDGKIVTLESSAANKGYN